MIASSLVLTYQRSGIFNRPRCRGLYHGLLYYQLHTGQHLSVAVSAIISVFVFAPLLGLALDRMLFRSWPRPRSLPGWWAPSAFWWPYLPSCYRP